MDFIRFCLPRWKTALHIDFVLDLDGTLVVLADPILQTHSLPLPHNVVSIRNPEMDSRAIRYEIVEGAEELVRALADVPGARISFFSSGKPWRNQQIVDILIRRINSRFSPPPASYVHEEKKESKSMLDGKMKRGARGDEDAAALQSALPPTAAFSHPHTPSPCIAPSSSPLSCSDGPHCPISSFLPSLSSSASLSSYHPLHSLSSSPIQDSSSEVCVDTRHSSQTRHAVLRAPPLPLPSTLPRHHRLRIFRIMSTDAGVTTKDLRLLGGGADLSRTILIDDNYFVPDYQLANILHINSVAQAPVPTFSPLLHQQPTVTYTARRRPQANELYRAMGVVLAAMDLYHRHRQLAPVGCVREVEREITNDSTHRKLEEIRLRGLLHLRQYNPALAWQ